MAGLPVSNLVNVQVQLSAIAAGVRNFGSLLILGSSDVIDVVERRRLYSSASAVATDFGATAPEYLAALAFFAQTPTPSQVYVGRWARTATAGLLHGGALAAAEQAMGLWTTITTGSLKVTIDGTLKTLSGLSFAGALNMNGVAAVVNTALGASGTCTWNANYARFDIKSATTGATSSVSYGSATGAGVDVSAQMRLTQATNAAAPVAGQVAETLAAAVTTHATNFDWYGLTIADPNAVQGDYLSVAGLIEAASPVRVFGVTTQDANALIASSTTDLAAQLQALGYSRTMVVYSSTNPYAVAAPLGRAFTVDFTQANSTITLMFQVLGGLTPETLSSTQDAALKGKSANAYVNYSNGTSIFQYGTMASGKYFDEVHGTDWWSSDVQTAIFNALYTSGSKIAQTDAGVNVLVAAASASCGRAKDNGLLAAGVWSGPTIGALSTGETMVEGFYVYAAPIATQSAADRGARKAPAIQIAGKFAGAIHSANVLINVNR